MTADGCTFPACNNPPETDRANCESHRNVRVSSSGSDVDDRHGEGGHG